MIEPDRARILAASRVSRETAERLDLYVAQLRRWQPIKNLVGPATLAEVWSRHIEDALQLLDLAPEARTWLDLGSGAGIPGLILAIAGQERGDAASTSSRATRANAPSSPRPPGSRSAGPGAQRPDRGR